MAFDILTYVVKNIWVCFFFFFCRKELPKCPSTHHPYGRWKCVCDVPHRIPCAVRFSRWNRSVRHAGRATVSSFIWNRDIPFQVYAFLCVLLLNIFTSRKLSRKSRLFPIHPFFLVQNSLIFVRIKRAHFCLDLSFSKLVLRDFTIKTLHGLKLTCEKPPANKASREWLASLA